MGGKSIGPDGGATIVSAGSSPNKEDSLNEGQMRFYIACVLAELTGNQAHAVATSLPSTKILDAIKRELRRVPEEDRNNRVGWAQQALLPFQIVAGLSYDVFTHKEVFQQVKNWAIITSCREPTTESIRLPYLRGLDSDVKGKVEFIWTICDWLPTVYKESLYQLVRATPDNMTFRAA